jgi:dienelactone hydrolase
MGEVYKAHDARLDRTVAIKVLPEHIAQRVDLRTRFEREARTVASLNHPHICVLYDIGTLDGVGGYMVMEYLEGETLAARIARGALPLDQALTVAIQITDALDRAHQSGVTHRDVKPQNIMLTRDGVKVLDFGLAKSAPKASAGSAEEIGTQTLAAEQTNPGTVMGTVAYMSPEQAEGKALDERSDIFSTGIVIYEMLAGSRPFQGGSTLSLLSSILRDQPEPLDHKVEGVPPEVSKLVARCLQKEKENRCSAAELRSGLSSCLQAPTAARSASAAKRAPRPGLRIAMALAAVVLVALGGWWFRQQSRVRWAREQLPRVSELAANGSFNAAFNLLQEVEAQDPSNPELHRLWGEVSRDIFLSSDPPGVDVFRKDLDAPEADWRLVGKTPMKNAKVPRGYYQFKFSGPNIETSLDVSSNNSADQTYRLSAKRPPEPGMVLINTSRRTLDISGVGNVAIDRISTFWMDATEVTNREFKRFIDQGGYRKAEFSSFRDPTGRPGPSTWEAGTYRAGQDDFAVTGVSWFEADAYCTAQGKQLPTLHHWFRAADPSLVAYVVKVGNFNGAGVVKVGSRGEKGPFGTQDLAGNAREWVSNSTGDGRNYILGGSWRDPAYLYTYAWAADSGDRSDTNGFRCMKSTEPLASEFTAPIRPREQVLRSEPPISDDTFRAYQSLYAYDPVDFGPAVHSTDNTPLDWTRVNVSYRAAYDQARIPAYLFLPKNTRPPYQAVIFIGGANMFSSASSEPPMDFPVLDYIIRSGRAVLYPIYTGTYERRAERKSVMTPLQGRQFWTRFVQDVMRSVDYLRSRTDIIGDKIGYTGKSYGSAFAPTVLALEPRLKAAVLLDGGRLGNFQTPEADPYFFAPRVRTPVLMLNGGQDFTFPVQTSQIPLFQSLGTPASQKQHLVFDAGHDVSSRYRIQVVREALNWWDRYMGPVQ